MADTVKKNTADVHKASAKVKGELPGRGQQYEKEAEATGRQAGAKFDEAVRSPPPLPYDQSIPLPMCPPANPSNERLQWHPREHPPLTRYPAQQLAKTQAELQKGKDGAAAYARDAKNATIQEIDKIDKKVEEKTSQAKSGISSWFGGK